MYYNEKQKKAIIQTQRIVFWLKVKNFQKLFINIHKKLNTVRVCTENNNSQKIITLIFLHGASMTETYPK